MKSLHHTSRNTPTEQERIKAYSALLQELEALQQELITAEHESAGILESIDVRHKSSAANLIHYLSLRRRDARPLQKKLAAAGLSSMGRAEAHVLSNLNAIIVLLQHALGKQVQELSSTLITPSVSGAALLESNTNNLLSDPPANRWVRIMVTLPTESASNYQLIKDMLLAGMDCARINCAHDNAVLWSRMIAHIKQASRETGRHCRILMDLAGPKLRTGQISLGAGVIKWRPHRDVYGNLIAPARIWLHPENESPTYPAQVDACLPVKNDWLQQLAPQDKVEFMDARGASRTLQVIEKVGAGFWAECNKTAYIKPGIKLNRVRKPVSKKPALMSACEVGVLPRIPEIIRLKRGDHLLLTREQIPGRPAQLDAEGHILYPASIACSIPEIFTSVQPGERILFDDGRIGGVIRKVNIDSLLIEITQARDTGEKLLVDKGINLPDTQLEIGGLTARDIEHLTFIARHADIVGLSFVHSPADIELLQDHLNLLGGQNLGIMIKIETRAAFEQLPGLLLALLRWPAVGVMIARGDLAVECGYERLAEMQEEILWLSEAAHVPVIWATQVLETLAKSGKPSRAEVTDAAMSERAECVMLNKGPHIMRAIQMLDNILQRMQAHQRKKSALLRRLHW